MLCLHFISVFKSAVVGPCSAHTCICAHSLSKFSNANSIFWHFVCNMCETNCWSPYAYPSSALSLAHSVSHLQRLFAIQGPCVLLQCHSYVCLKPLSSFTSWGTTTTSHLHPPFTDTPLHIQETFIQTDSSMSVC